MWTDEQIAWLKSHLETLHIYLHMTSLNDVQSKLRYEIAMLQQVLSLARANSCSTPLDEWRDKRPVSPQVWAWVWWSYWYSACWLMTRFSPSREHAEQLQASMAFRLSILDKREAMLEAVKRTHTDVRIR